MYNNLNVEWCLEQITELIQRCDFLLNGMQEGLVKKPDAVHEYDINIWPDLQDLKQEVLITLFQKNILELLRISLLEFPLCICKYYPNFVFKQLRGIAMGNNASLWVANLSLANLELKQQVLLQYPFFSCYIDDVHTLVHFTEAFLKRELKKFNLVKKQLENIYVPSGLKLNFEDLDNTEWIPYLDIRIPRQVAGYCLCFTSKRCMDFKFHTLIPLVQRGFWQVKLLVVIRLFNKSSHWTYYIEVAEAYLNMLGLCSYSKAWVLKILRIHERKSHEQLAGTQKDKVAYHIMYDFHPTIIIPELYNSLSFFIDKQVAFTQRVHLNLNRWTKRKLIKVVVESRKQKLGNLEDIIGIINNMEDLDIGHLNKRLLERNGQAIAMEYLMFLVKVNPSTTKHIGIRIKHCTLLEASPPQTSSVRQKFFNKGDLRNSQLRKRF